MIATIEHHAGHLRVDLSKPIDISIPLSPAGPRAWYVAPMRFSPVISQQFRGSVKLGGSVNFNDVFFNPHGHSTHTESVGHISSDACSINEVLRQFFFTAMLITVKPEKVKADEKWQKAGDDIIRRNQLEVALKGNIPEALVVRTLPNSREKLNKNYSDTNFPYFEGDALAFLAEIGVKHLLVDLPSVDRETDGGLLKAHHAFWKYPESTRRDCSITEFVFIPDSVADGSYLLELQVAPFENDAACSRPLLYALLS